MVEIYLEGLDGLEQCEVVILDKLPDLQAYHHISIFMHGMCK